MSIRITLHQPPLSLPQVAKMLGVSEQRLLVLCRKGRVEGAFKLSGCWLFSPNFQIREGKNNGGPLKRRANSLSEYRRLQVQAPGSVAPPSQPSAEPHSHSPSGSEP